MTPTRWHAHLGTRRASIPATYGQAGFCGLRGGRRRAKGITSCRGGTAVTAVRTRRSAWGKRLPPPPADLAKTARTRGNGQQEKGRRRAAASGVGGGGCRGARAAVAGAGRVQFSFGAAHIDSPGEPSQPPPPTLIFQAALVSQAPISEAPSAGGLPAACGQWGHSNLSRLSTATVQEGPPAARATRWPATAQPQVRVRAGIVQCRIAARQHCSRPQPARTEAPPPARAPPRRGGTVAAPPPPPRCRRRRRSARQAAAPAIRRLCGIAAAAQRASSPAGGAGGAWPCAPRAPQVWPPPLPPRTHAPSLPPPSTPGRRGGPAGARGACHELWHHRAG